MGTLGYDDGEIRFAMPWAEQANTEEPPPVPPSLAMSAVALSHSIWPDQDISYAQHHVPGVLRRSGEPLGLSAVTAKPDASSRLAQSPKSGAVDDQQQHHRVMSTDDRPHDGGAVAAAGSWSTSFDPSLKAELESDGVSPAEGRRHPPTVPYHPLNGLDPLAVPSNYNCLPPVAALPHPTVPILPAYAHPYDARKYLVPPGGPQHPSPHLLPAQLPLPPRTYKPPAPPKLSLPPLAHPTASDPQPSAPPSARRISPPSPAAVAAPSLSASTIRRSTPNPSRGAARPPSNQHVANKASDGTAGGTRRRTPIACERCRAHKLRCLGGRPCPACEKRGVGPACTYVAEVRRRGKAKKGRPSALPPKDGQGEVGPVDDDDRSEDERQHGPAGSCSAAAGASPSSSAAPAVQVVDYAPRPIGASDRSPADSIMGRAGESVQSGSSGSSRATTTTTSSTAGSGSGGSAHHTPGPAEASDFPHGLVNQLKTSSMTAG